MATNSSESRLFGRYRYYVPDVAEGFILLLFLLLGAILGNILSAILLLVVKSGLSTEISMLVSYPTMFIPPMIYASIRSKSNSYGRSGVQVDSNNFGKAGALKLALTAALMTLSTALVADFFSSLMPPVPEFLKAILEQMTGGNIWIDLICVSIFAPFFEEWLCRGMVLRGLLNRNIRPVWAIVISAAFFALIHLNPWQALPAFMLGCIFGYVYYKTGSIKLTMLMHFTNNTFAVITSRIPALEEMESFREVFPGAAYWVVFTACVILTALCILVYRKISLHTPEGNCDKVPSMFDE